MADEELDSGFVCRLVPSAGRFPPDNVKPCSGDFRPSSRDMEEADRLEKKTLLSVWDEKRTALDQAKAIYGQADCVGFGLNVKEIIKLEVPDSTRHLQVVRDPLPADEARKPGGDGHCGIVGLRRPKGKKKKDYRELRLRLCELAQIRG